MSSRTASKRPSRRAKVQIAVFVSGFGSNLEALLKAEKRGSLGGEIALVVCDRPDAYALIRAKKHRKTSFLIPAKFYKARQAFEERIIAILRKMKIDLVVLAGFMRILTPYFVMAYRGRIINIHPSLLPAFKGAHAIRDAFHFGGPLSGVTVHYVTEELDSGPVILQQTVTRTVKDTLASFEKKIHQVEHELYPRAVRLVAQKRIKLKGRFVQIKKK